jgi:hypothetical protein
LSLYGKFHAFRVPSLQGNSGWDTTVVPWLSGRSALLAESVLEEDGNAAANRPGSLPGSVPPARGVGGNPVGTLGSPLDFLEANGPDIPGGLLPPGTRI